MKTTLSIITSTIIGITLLVVALAFIFKHAGAKSSIVDLGAMGESYEIIEVDFERYMKDKMASVDFAAILEVNFDKAYENYTTAKVALPPATRDNVRRLTPSHTLAQEIAIINKAGEKQVLYPAGFTFNPLSYMQLSEIYIIVNANNKAEVEWLKTQDELDSAIIMLSGGNVAKFSEELQLPLYLLNDYIKDALFLEKTPSIVRQEGEQLAIYEYAQPTGSNMKEVANE